MGCTIRIEEFTVLNEEEIKDYFQSGFYEDYYGWRFSEEESQTEAEQVLKLLEVKKGHILDWCRSWSRYSLYFAKKGFQVTILDYIGKYLDLAKKRFNENNLIASTIETDCRNNPSTIQADFRTCLLNSIGFLKKPEQLRAFKSLYSVLKPGAKIIIDCMNLFAIKRFIQTTERPRKNGSIFRSHKRFDFGENVEYMIFEIIKPNGTIRRKEFTQMHYTPSELRELVERAVFQVNEIYGSFEGVSISFDSSKIVLIAQK